MESAGINDCRDWAEIYSQLCTKQLSRRERMAIY
jgi:hypothetical protein